MENEKEKLELERQKIEVEKMRLELELKKFEFEREKQKTVNQMSETKYDKDEDTKKDDFTDNTTITDNIKKKEKEIQFSEIQEGMEIAFDDPDGNLLDGKITKVSLGEGNKIVGCEVETADERSFDLSIEEDKIYIPSKNNDDTAEKSPPILPYIISNQLKKENILRNIIIVGAIIVGAWYFTQNIGCGSFFGSGCAICNGTGEIDCPVCKNGISDCPVCVNGRNQFGYCTFCNGRGETGCTFCNQRGETKCTFCNGTGKGR